jgi:uncharacterized protein (DUF58 family)
VAAGLLFLQIFSPTPATKFVLWTISGVIIVSYVWVRLMSQGVVIKRLRRHGWAQVGDTLEERFTMHNHSWVSVPWAEVRDYSNLPGYNASRAVGLSAKRFTRWEKRCMCTQRGEFTLGPIEILMGDPFGLFEIAVRHDYSEVFVVYPAIATLPALLNPRGLSRGSGRANDRSLDVTTNASGVRGYVPGDALNRIHWRTTARRSLPWQEDLFVREYDLEPSGDVWLILDLNAGVHAGEGMVSTEEYQVILAASLAEQLLTAQHAVGLVAYGQEPLVIWPRKGYHQLWEILRTLAGTHANSEHDLNQVLHLSQGILGRGMSAAIITPSANAEWVQALPDLLLRGVHPTALLLDATSFGGTHSPQGVERSLADLGVISHVLDTSLRLEEAGQRVDRRSFRPQTEPDVDDRQATYRRRSAPWVAVGHERGA